LLPTPYRIVLSPRASADITAIHRYIEQDSPQSAAGVTRSLFEAIDSLALLPHRYRVFQTSRSTKRQTRVMPVSPYLIYYQVLEDDRVVRVITVRHGAQRQPRSFN
jgi:toxin ParE1/3/4